MFSLIGREVKWRWNLDLDLQFVIDEYECEFDEIYLFESDERERKKKACLLDCEHFFLIGRKKCLKICSITNSC